MQRRHFVQGAALVTLHPLLARAQAWPTKPIRIVVPFAPGGTTDFVTRLVATEVAKSLGQAIVVENKPGAGTVIGVDNVAKSAPDGSSFVTVANSFTVNQTLVTKLPYDGLKDLRPVALMGLSEHVLATHPASGLKTVADIVAQAKAGKPLSYASFGNGTSAHLAGEMLKNQLGVDIVHVPYKGQAPALADLLGGQVSMMFGNWPEFRSHVQSGKLLAIGMATAARSVYAPQIPTLAEQGVPVVSNSWNGLLAPAGVPDAIVQRMNAEVNRAMQATTVAEAFQKGGIAAKSGTPEQFADFIRSETARYAEVIRKSGITLD
ncbi:MAG: tripartite tricarboxylate transporter substrate binding protein [Proteobacteria bacterium]|nr:tripartite tricarboxylate transporter substrate binding protein [Pseudomonadota bacterium]MBS0492420.1 tripartite tricarboxylate transporter substrate binding protein [Pseudomonadota bacterium]